MKTDNTSQPDAEILAKYLCGEMNEAEERAFMEEISASDQKLIMLETMKKQWSAIEGYDDNRKPDTSKAWNKLHARLEDDNLIPAKATAGRNSLMPTQLRVAAVVVILIATAVVIIVSQKSKTLPPAEMVKLNTVNETNTLVKTLTDGSVIYIAQNSMFSFPKEFETGSRNVGLKGEAFFDIASNPSKPFIIETDEAFIQVLGTAFNVKTQNGEGFELVVDRGKVKVTLKNDPSHSEFVTAGEKISTVKNNLVKSKQSLADANTWYRQRMHFKDESLHNIISVLNRNFNTTFVVGDKQTGNRKLTVTFRNETAASMTELICTTLNLKSQTINGAVVLSDKNTRQQ
jgi:transmembrane sensor